MSGRVGTIGQDGSGAVFAGADFGFIPIQGAAADVGKAIQLIRKFAIRAQVFAMWPQHGGQALVGLKILVMGHGGNQSEEPVPHPLGHQGGGQGQGGVNHYEFGHSQPQPVAECIEQSANDQQGDNDSHRAVGWGVFRQRSADIIVQLLVLDPHPHAEHSDQGDAEGA